MAALVDAAYNGNVFDDASKAGDDVASRLFNAKTEGQRRKRQSFFQLVSDLDTSIKGGVAAVGPEANIAAALKTALKAEGQTKFPLNTYLPPSPRKEAKAAPAFGEGDEGSRWPSGKPTPSKIPRKAPREPAAGAGAGAGTKKPVSNLLKPTIGARYKRMSFYSASALEPGTIVPPPAAVTTTPTTDRASAPASAAGATSPTSPPAPVVVAPHVKSRVNINSKAYITGVMKTGERAAAAKRDRPYVDKESHMVELSAQAFKGPGMNGKGGMGGNGDDYFTRRPPPPPPQQQHAKQTKHKHTQEDTSCM